MAGRTSEQRMRREMARTEQRYGSMDSEQREHITKMHSAQRGDISLDKKPTMRGSIKALTDMYEPLSRLGKKR